VSRAEKVYCEDWGCPAAISCAHHFGRSREYAGGMRETGYRLAKFQREPEADSCRLYEFDRVKPWLQSKPGQYADAHLVGRFF
jgi:hypothetical protein